MKQYTHREFVKIVKANGFHYDRHSGDHAIYLNDKGRHISIPAKLESVIARRLIKENSLELDIKKLKKMDNLPAGAKDDPRAPFNEEPYEEVEVLASITYSKSMSIHVPKGSTEEEIKAFAKKSIFRPHEALGGTWTIDEFEIIQE
jgi:predicted RNA binding protein YcfA (HicA-like mRNA interferase family)|nr:MAG TPA: HICA protein [Crassvirales sp.]